MKLFNFSHIKNNIEHYSVSDGVSIFIDSINIETGKMSKKKIIDYSIHKDLMMYKIVDNYDRFKPFWVSSDHSLIVYEKDSEKLIKASPIDLIINVDNYMLVQKINDEYIFIECNELSILCDPEITTAADFTVEDNYTFSTDDGIFVQDTMSLYAPLSVEAQQDMDKLLNPYSPGDPRSVQKYTFNKDYAFAACVILTDDKSKYWWAKKIKYKNENTTSGKVKLYECLDEESRKIIDFGLINKTSNIGTLVEILFNTLPNDKVRDFLNKLVLILNDIMTENSKTLSMNDFALADEFLDIRKKLSEAKTLEDQQKIFNTVPDSLMKVLTEKSEISDLMKCKAAKINQLSQLLVTKGLIQSPSGNTELINNNLASGLLPTEYFKAGNGARDGIVSRVNKTAQSGYLTRQLVYALASVELNEHDDDCGTRKTIDLNVVDSDFFKRIINRFIYYNGNLIKVTPDMKEIIGKTVQLRTPIYCIDKEGICKTCYGDDSKYLDSKYVGVITAQTIGERLVQETMKAFHLGGVVNISSSDPIKELSLNTKYDREFWDKYLSFNPKLNILSSNVDCSIILDKELYNLNYVLNSPDNTIMLDNLLGDIIFDNKKYPLAIDSPVILNIPTKTVKEKNEYILYYDKSEADIAIILNEINDIAKTSKKLLSLISSGAGAKDINHMLMKMYSLMKDYGSMILVHFEILISQLFRCANNHYIPLRLCDNTNDYYLATIKQIPYLESWVRGLEFEKFNESILNALNNPIISRRSYFDKFIIDEVNE